MTPRAAYLITELPTDRTAIFTAQNPMKAIGYTGWDPDQCLVDPIWWCDGGHWTRIPPTPQEKSGYSELWMCADCSRLCDPPHRPLLPTGTITFKRPTI